MSEIIHHLKIDADYYMSKVNQDDIQQLVRHLNVKEIYECTLSLPHPYTEYNAGQFIKSVDEEENKSGRLMQWSLRNKSGEMIGSVGLQGFYGKESHKDKIGYWLAKSYWNKGIMSKALKTFCTYCLDENKLVRIEADIYDFNKASVKVVERCGFIYEGLQRKFILKNGHKNVFCMF